VYIKYEVDGRSNFESACLNISILVLAKVWSAAKLEAFCGSDEVQKKRNSHPYNLELLCI